jgi:hypothetical protein
MSRGIRRPEEGTKRLDVQPPAWPTQKPSDLSGLESDALPSPRPRASLDSSPFGRLS